MSAGDDGEAGDRGAKEPVGPAPAASPTPTAAAAPAAPAPKAAPPPPATKPKAPERPKPPMEPEIPQAPPWYRQLRTDPPSYLRLVLGFSLVAAVLILWWFLTRGDVVDRIISPVKLPSPGEVFGSFGSLWDRELVANTLDTLTRVLKGTLLAAIIGVAVGVLAASQRGVNAAIAPIIIFLRSVPMGALVPMTLLMFGDGEKQKTMFIFLAIVPFVFSDTVKAVSIVPERFVETAQTLGASRFQIIRKVLVPLALPDVITSLRFQFGLALGYIMLVESINVEFGLGKLINVSRTKGPFEHVYLLLFVIAVIAFMLDLLLRTLQRGAFSWRKDL